MASIGRKELQEGIVGPLIDMMGSLSEEMRKNLSKEVSSINGRLDEMNRKITYLIDRVEENINSPQGKHYPTTFKTLPSNAFVQSDNVPIRSRIHEQQFEICECGVDTTERPVIPEKRPPHDKTQHPDENKTAELANTSKQTVPFELEKNDNVPLEHATESGMNGATQENESTSKTEQFQNPCINMNGFADDIDFENRTVKEEREESERNDTNVVKSEHVQQAISKPNAEGDLALKQAREKRDFPMKSDDRKRDEAEKSNDEVKDTTKITERKAQDEGKRLQDLFNSKQTDLHRRPQSPPPKKESKENVSYTNFRKMRTEFTQDNRTVYLKDAFCIKEDDLKDESLQTQTIDQSEKNKQDNVSEKFKDSAVVGRSTHEKVPSSSTENSLDIAKMSNNQQLAPSGFRNEHGNDDNRFVSAAHADRRTALMHRSIDMSNLKLVKNGPRRPAPESVSLDPDLTSPQMEVTKTKTSQHARQSELVEDAVLYSLIEQERKAAGESNGMKSQGIDTVILLDTSASMAGKPLKVAIDTIKKLLDGFESNAIYHDLEENVALVTFGNQNKIQCHLTNDYGVVRDGLDNLTAGGPSPLWLGLALSLAEIKERAGACIMDPMTVLPRIILVTDGFASRKNLLEGEDICFVDDQVIREIVSLLSTCSASTSYLECIKTGRCHEDLLTSLTNGRVFTPNQVDQITEFFRVQERANEIIKVARDGDIRIDEAVQNSKLSPKGKDDLRQIVNQSIPSTVEQKEEIHEDKPKESNHSNTSEEEKPDEPPTSLEREFPDRLDSMQSVDVDSLDDVTAPPFGTKVEANPEWVGYASRQNFIGTVIGSRKKGMVKTLWSDGTTERCKFGVNGQYDIVKSKNQTVNSDTLQIGSYVSRGKDWRWKDQDGGLGSVGVVIKIELPVVNVIWPHGGQGNYRYGYNKKYDLTLCKTRHYVVEEQHYAWFIEEEVGQWKPFPPEVNDSIEQMYQAKHSGTFLVKMDDKSLRVAIQHFHARDPSTQSTYSIERRELSEEEWLALTSEL